MKTEIKVTLSSFEAAVLLDLLREKIDSLEKSLPVSEVDTCYGTDCVIEILNF